VSVLWLAGTWLGVGLAASLAVRRPRLRAAVVLAVPLLLLIATLLASPDSGAPAPLAGAPPSLSRVGQGVLVAAAAALWLCLLLTERVGGTEVLGFAAAGAAVALMLGARSPLLFGVAALLAVAALALSWIQAAPGRGTLAAGRVAGTGAAALVGAAVFLPASGQGDAGVAVAAMASGLLAAGVVAILALVPLGGWAAGAMGTLRAADAAVWLLLLAPAVLVSSLGLPSGLPLAARLALEHTLLACGLLSALWAGALAIRVGALSRPSTDCAVTVTPSALRYRRLALGDLALAAAAIGTGQPEATPAVLLLIATHLLAGPLLLQGPRAGLDLPRRGLWLALCGIPPSPSFWGRFLVLQACAGFGGPSAIPCVVAQGLMTLAAILAIARGEGAAAVRARPHQIAAAWALAAAAVVIAVVPLDAIRVVFGPGA
jgi:hypothetical protein